MKRLKILLSQRRVGQFTLAAVGIGLVFYQTNGLIVLGIISMIWANNMDYESRSEYNARLSELFRLR